MYLGLERGPVIVEPRMGSSAMVAQVQDKPWVTELRVLGEPEDYWAVLAGLARDMGAGERGAIGLGEHAWAKSAVAFQRAVPDVELVNAHDLIWPMRMIKDDEERTAMRRAAALIDRVYEAVLPELRLGMGRREIAWLIDEIIFAHGADWMSFHTGIYIGGRAEVGAPDVFDSSVQRVLEPGGSLAFDFGALLDGYCSDFGRTVFIGEPTPQRREVYGLVMRAQSAAIAAMVDGQITAEQLDDVARSIITEAGHGPQFIHRLGHSIGKDVHEPPFLLKGDQTVLRTGMFFTIEPSVVLNDGGFIRVEDVVMVSENGGENYNETDHELRVIEL
jgi:Xaa-Pro aminopeptidase